MRVYPTENSNRCRGRSWIGSLKNEKERTKTDRTFQELCLRTHTLMFPVSQLISPRMQAASSSSGLISPPFQPIHALSATKCSPLSITSEKLGCSASSLSTQPTHLVVGASTRRTTLICLYLPPPNNSNPNSTRRERGRGWRRRAGTAVLQGSLGSSRSRSPFSSRHGASASTLSVSATAITAAGSPDDFSSQAEAPQKPILMQTSRVLSSLSEKPAGKESAENSGEDGEEEGRVQKTTTVLQAGGQESGRGSEPLVITEEEYKLTEEGTLSTVKLTRGGTTHRTNTKVDRVLAEVGVQAETLQNNIRNFSVRKFIKDWGKKEPGLENLKFNAAMYDPKDGVSNIAQWTATELTLQRGQLVRISRDSLYLVWAFSLFGGVRILEAVVSVFATSPPNFMKLTAAMNAMDPLTVASLANELRKPVEGMLNVDPTNLEEVSSLKVKFWSELHKFYERQWKVIATLGVARLFALIVTHLPAAQRFTSKLKVVWDITMALPIF